MQVTFTEMSSVATIDKVGVVVVVVVMTMIMMTIMTIMTIMLVIMALIAITNMIIASNPFFHPGHLVSPLYSRFQPTLCRHHRFEILLTHYGDFAAAFGCHAAAHEQLGGGPSRFSVLFCSDLYKGGV